MRAAIVDLGRRLALRVEQEQAFAAHAAHALRTPLAGLDAQLAMAIKEVPDPARKRLLRAREAAARLKSVVTSLLAMFRSHAAVEPKPIWIGSVLARLPIEGLEIHVEQKAPLVADANLVAAALSNLLDNAQRCGAKHCWISVQQEQTAPTLTLRDDGIGMPVEQIERVLSGVNDPSHERHSGLGLKLAALVARAHHGRLRITHAQPDGRGLSVSLSFWEDGVVPATESATGQSLAPAPAIDRHDRVA